MTTPGVPLIAHYNGQTGQREVSLRVVAIDGKAMYVLCDSKLISVYVPPAGLTLDCVEYFTSSEKKKV